MDHVAQREGAIGGAGGGGGGGDRGGAASAAFQQALAVLAVPSQLLRLSNFSSGRISKMRKFAKDLLLRAGEAFPILDSPQMYKG